jgi:hypothetical protein
MTSLSEKRRRPRGLRVMDARRADRIVAMARAHGMDGME